MGVTKNFNEVAVSNRPSTPVKSTGPKVLVFEATENNGSRKGPGVTYRFIRLYIESKIQPRYVATALLNWEGSGHPGEEIGSEAASSNLGYTQSDRYAMLIWPC